MRVNGKLFRLNRVILERRIKRPLSSGEHALHTCDDPRCIESSHIRLGSHTENMRDVSIKWRGGALKLCLSDKQEIRRLKASGMKQCSIAKKFGVSDSCVSAIINKPLSCNLPTVNLSIEDIKNIKHLKQTGVKQTDIAKQFRITDSRVSMIVNHKTYIHI